MSPLNFLDQYDKNLKKSCWPPWNFKENNYTTPDGKNWTSEEVFNALRDKLIASKGLGLAAPQVGIFTRAFVIGNHSDPDSIIGIFNPIIANIINDELVTMEEGCLTFPGLYIKIKRPKSIRVRYANFNGEVNSFNFDGITARVFQHELDHLDGILYTSRANAFHLVQARNQMKRLNRMKKRNSKS